MESSAARILVVANKTAATPSLLDAVRERAARGPCRFTLLVPNTTHGLHKVVDPEDQSQKEAEATIELALFAPILATLVIGVIDMSMAFGRKLAVEQAAQRAIEKVMNGQADKSTVAALKTEAAIPTTLTSPKAYRRRFSRDYRRSPI